MKAPQDMELLDWVADTLPRGIEEPLQAYVVETLKEIADHLRAREDDDWHDGRDW